MKKEKRKIEYYAKSTLLSRGWSEKSIDELLPPPKLVDNPYYKCASCMQLWERKIVHQKERTKKFKEYAEKKNKRSQAMQKSIDKRKSETIEMAKSFDITVERIDIDELREETLSAKWNWYMNTEQYDRAEFVYSADLETLARWEINYIRHNLTNYDDELEKLYRQVGKTDAYYEYRKNLMEKIKETYPELKEYI